MKAVILVVEHPAGEPLRELDGRTALQVARCPAATRLALEGRCGWLAKPPGGETGRPEAYLAGLCGVPRLDAWRMRRGPLETEAVDGAPTGYAAAYRADLVTIDDGFLRDGWLARLTLSETQHLFDAVQGAVDGSEVRLRATSPGRGIAIFESPDTLHDAGTAPWIVEGELIEDAVGHRSKPVERVSEAAVKPLADDAVNHVRVDLGENPASGLWMWGGGARHVPLERWKGRELKTLMVTQSAMATGLAKLLGMTVAELPDPWGGPDASRVVTPEQIAGWMNAHDVVVIYVEAPVGLVRGPSADRVRLLERLDYLLIAPVLEGARKLKHRRILLAALDPAESMTRGARGRTAPVVLWGAHVDPDPVTRWDELSVEEGDLVAADPNDLMERVVGG